MNLYTMTFANLARIEYIKLFRRSNLLFFFLAAYLFITPIGRGYDEIKTLENPVVSDFFIAMVNSFSIMGLLLMAIFMVNSTGNDFNEGSYRKGIAMGLPIQDYFKGKLVLTGFVSVFVILSVLIFYLIFAVFFLRADALEIARGIKLVSILNQFVALTGAASFGLFFIMFFRNRTIGLVFFPFWFITEFIVYLLDKSGRQRLLAEFFPGISTYELYTGMDLNIQTLMVVVIYITIFLTTAWYGLTLREEKAG
jgi:hypothetical protein